MGDGRKGRFRCMEAGMILPFRNTGNISDPFIVDKIMGLRYAPLSFWKSRNSRVSPPLPPPSRSRVWPDGCQVRWLDNPPPPSPLRFKALCGGAVLCGFLLLLLWPRFSPAETNPPDPFEAVVRGAENILPSVVTLEVTIPRSIRRRPFWGRGASARASSCPGKATS